MRKLLAAIGIAAIGTLGIPGGAAAEGGFTHDPDKEAEFVSLINALRADQGLETLELHGELVAKARDWSLTMAEAGEIWHSHLPDGITANWQRLGENVGMGGSVSALHQAFVDSPSHYENLIDPGFRYVGLGVTVDANGTIFVSEVFMELASQPAPAASSPAAGAPSNGDTADADPSEEASANPVSNEQPRNISFDLPAPDPRSDSAADAAGSSGPSERLVSVLDRLRALDG